jgi:hypothetical protein
LARWFAQLDAAVAGGQVVVRWSVVRWSTVSRPRKTLPGHSSLRDRPNLELIRLVDEHPANFQAVQLDEIELYIVKVPLAP